MNINDERPRGYLFDVVVFLVIVIAQIFAIHYPVRRRDVLDLEARVAVLETRISKVDALLEQMSMQLDETTVLITDMNAASDLRWVYYEGLSGMVEDLISKGKKR